MLTSDFFDALDQVILISEASESGEYAVDTAARALAAAGLEFLNVATSSILRDVDRQESDDRAPA